MRICARFSLIMICLLLLPYGKIAFGQEAACLFDDPALSLGHDLPVVPCSGVVDCPIGESDLSSSPTLLGDCGGLRTHLGESGISVTSDLTQFYFGVAHGGTDREFRYGGHGDLVILADGSKLGLQEGLFLKMRVENRFGESISSATGALMPATILPDLPVSDSENVYLTNFLLTQFLSENFAVFLGKLDTLDGDANAYAHGRGKTQFSNMALVANPIVLRTVPYSSLAAGFSVLRDQQPIFTFTAINPVDTTRTSGFEELFAEGVTLTAELRLPTEIGGLPGHQLIGGSWSSRSYVSLGQDPRIITGNVPINRTDGSWSLYWNFDQTLIASRENPAQGWGVFGRAGIGDDHANPIAWFLSCGIGGTSFLPQRQQDTFGVGWYYLAASNEITLLSGLVSDGQGVELFYNFEATPWFHITPDLQVLLPGRVNVETALVLGLRANISF